MLQYLGEKMDIPNEAIDAAAKQLFAESDDTGPIECARLAVVALRAAAPFMLADATLRAYNEGIEAAVKVVEDCDLSSDKRHQVANAIRALKRSATKQAFHQRYQWPRQSWSPDQNK